MEEVNTQLSTLTPQEAAAVGSILGGMMSVAMIVSLAFTVLMIIAHWKMFTKAGEKGWKSLIPFYCDFVLFRLVWDTKNYWVYLVSMLIGTILIPLGSGITVASNGQVAVTGAANPVLAVIGFAALVVTLVWSIRCSLKTAHAYGKGTGFGVGLILLPNIFTLILAFGSAEYVGPEGDSQARFENPRI